MLNILKNIKGCTTLEWSRHNTQNGDFWNLTYSNAYILIKSSTEHFAFIKWREFRWIIDIEEITQDFWFSIESTKNDSKGHTFLHLINAWKYKFINYLHLWDGEVNQIIDDFPPNVLDSEYDWEFIIIKFIEYAFQFTHLN